MFDVTDEASSAAPPKGRRKSSRPPGPSGFSLFRDFLKFGGGQLEFITRNARTYGDVVYVDVGGWPSILISDPDDIEQLLVRDHKSFTKSRLTLRHVKALFGNGLLSSDGPTWLRNRRLASPAFAGQQLLGYGPDIVGPTQRMLEGWQDGEIRDANKEMMALTLRIAAKTFMDSEVEEDIGIIDRAMTTILEEMVWRFKRPFVIADWIPLPGNIRYRRAIAAIDRVIERMIADRRKNGYAGRADLLSRLMQARDDDNKGMSDKQLRDETITLLLAGHETTALALAWSFYLLGQHPEASRRLAAELGEVAPDRWVTIDDIGKLKFTEAVVLESMRLYPPAWMISRENTVPFKLREYEFKPATTVFVSPWVLHRDPRHFPEPEAFRPERWLDGLARRLPRCAYMPFGGGPRICIGQRFAMIEAVLILATIAQRFSVEWQRNRPISLLPSITLRAKGGVWVKLLAHADRPATSATPPA